MLPQEQFREDALQNLLWCRMTKQLTRQQRMRALGQVLCPCCGGDGFWGDPENGPAGNCNPCSGSGYVAEAVAEDLEMEGDE